MSWHLLIFECYRVVESPIACHIFSDNYSSWRRVVIVVIVVDWQLVVTFVVMSSGWSVVGT